MGFGSDSLDEKCFNGHKLFYYDWFHSQTLSISPHTHGPWKGNLLAFVDTDLDHTSPVVIRVGDLYIVFNRAIKHNKGVPDKRDMVTIVQAQTTTSVSWILTGISTDKGVASRFEADAVFNEGKVTVVVEVCSMELHEANERRANFAKIEIRTINDVPTCPRNGTLSSGLLSAPPSALFECFSGDSVVIVEGQGERRMRDLKLGNRVLTRHDKFETVYSFGHFDHDNEADFLLLEPSNLEISPKHMVFVQSRGAIPASTVQVGDILEGGSKITEIHVVKKKGMYAPFTSSGTISVNGVVASSYIAFQESRLFKIGPIPTTSHHWLAHTFEIPHRIWCLYLVGCDGERYTESGISVWVSRPLKAASWLVQQHPVIISLLVLPIIFTGVTFCLVEALVNSPQITALLFVCIAWVVTTRAGLQLKPKRPCKSS
jgi:hypothetical protein